MLKNYLFLIKFCYFSVYLTYKSVKNELTKFHKILKINIL